ncbi:hypothetical protein [Telluribacter sp.]|jgi:hypothetical protein|uniref:hypothetical protein n=1 Tax=Telluribacter sp. TaxID=1978767 RepID=UPI002E13A570|nr:hypothetical protein [Telluribacter sp.]
MKKSNIFAYVELSKLVGNLHGPVSPLKERLKAQAAYFNIIDPKFFSEPLAREWETILSTVKRGGVPLEDGRMLLNQVANTIGGMSEEECQLLVQRLKSLHQKLEAEIKQ